LISDLLYEGVDSISRGKKIITALYVVVLIWAIISAYFYNQHYITVKTYAANEKIVLEDTTLFIKQVTMEQYQRKAMPFDPNDIWYYKAASKLPKGFQLPFLKLCHFYSTPYEFLDNKAVIKVKGIIVKTSPGGIEPHDFYRMRIYDDKTNYYGRSLGFTHRQDSNIYLFRVRGEKASPDLNCLKLVIDSNSGDREKVLSLEPKWKTKTYNTLQDWPPKYEFDPLESVFEVFHMVKYENDKKLQDFVLPKVRDDFPWARIRHNYWESNFTGHFIYMKEYKGFKDVFAHTIVFRERDDLQSDNIAEQPVKDIAEQKLYLIDTGEAWRIIDVGPLEELPH